MRITLGADPEVFLEYPHGTVKSAIGYVGGTKEEPKVLSREGFFVQEDNVAAEFNIPPASTAEEFVESIQWAIKAIDLEVDRYGFKTRISASEFFPEFELTAPQAMIFGCEPDYNAWTLNMNPRPHSSEPSLRSCGGHIHVAVDVPVSIPQMVQSMDLFVGVPSVMMDADVKRRELYGQAGAHRTTQYDVTSWEYRVPSNFWIRTPQLTRWAYEQTVRAVRWAARYSNNEWSAFLKGHDLGHKIQKCINNSDVGLSHQLIQNYSLVVV